MLGGIYSKNKYRYLGGVRRGVSSVRYEISFSLNVMVFILYNKSYVLECVNNLGLLLMFFSFFVRSLIELGRTPFDFSESESELVRGFNTEYSRVGFVLIFLKEYGSLLFFSVLSSTLFAGGSFLFSFFVFSLFIVVRRSFPRLRYDKIISLMWLQLFFHVASVLWCSFFILLA